MPEHPPAALPADIITPSGIRAALAAAGVRPRKRLGQHFLADRGTRDRILAAAHLCRTDRVLEIGAGLGALTQALAAQCAEVVAVEIDRRLAHVLQDHATAPNLRVLVADVLQLDFAQMLQTPSWKVVSNLPFAITSPVLARLTDTRAWWTDVTVTMQREVADRLTARPGGSDYGTFSIGVQFWFAVKRHGPVRASVFYPRPAVDATLLTLTPRAAPAVPVTDPARYFRVVRAAFAHRRKTLLNALATADLALDRDRAGALLRSVEIDPTRRAQTLSLADFARLADALPEYAATRDAA